MSGLILACVALAGGVVASASVPASASTGSTSTSTAPASASPWCPNGVTPTVVAQSDTAPDIKRPASFDPTTASDAQLASLRLPPRPTGSALPGWLHAMKQWNESVPSGPIWQCADQNFGPGPSSISWSNTWVGNVIRPDLGNDGGAPVGTYQDATIDFHAQPIGPDQGVSAGINPWVGLGYGQNYLGTGAASHDQLVQAGLEESYCTGCVSPIINRVFYEVYPKESAHFPGEPVVNINDEVYVDVEAVGTQAYFFIENATTGKSHLYPETFNGYSGGSVEWVNERAGLPLAQWSGALALSQAEFYSPARGGWTCAGVPSHWSFHMASDLKNPTATQEAYPAAWLDSGYCSFPIYRTSVY